MREDILWGILMAVYGAGGLLLLIGKQPEQGNRSTLGGMIRMTALRFRKWMSERPGPGQVLTEKYQGLQYRKIDQEIHDSSMLLKNLAIAERQRAFSADYLYERLMENAVRLKSVYAELLTLYRSGRDREAFQVFRERCRTRAARNFSLILEKLEQINPEELVEQMEVFQEMMQQQKMTEDMKQVQRNSLITTAAATAVVFVMVIDFAVVLVFMHTITLLESVF